jgi:hypothetical protein
MLYELLTTTLRPGTIGDGMKRIEAAPPKSHGGATLLGFWITEIGPLNRMVSLWSHTDDEQHAADSVDLAWMRPIDEFISAIESERYRLFPFLNEIPTGKYGPFYELRSYRLRHGMLQNTFERWKGKIEGRMKLSPLIAVMYSVSGPLEKFVHLWPYESLEQRLKIRTRAVAEGLWPPPGGAASLAEQENSILLPLSFSPLQ